MTNLTGIQNLNLVVAVCSGRVLVAGAGASGRGAVMVLKDIGYPEAVAMDDSALGILVTVDFSVQHITTAGARDEFADVAAVATFPGWCPTSPLFGVVAEAGISVSGDMALAFVDDCAQLRGPKHI